MFTVGTQDLNEAQKMPARTKLRGNGMLLPYKKLLTTSTTQSYMNAFYVTQFAVCAVLFNKDTLYPTSMSSPSTSTTPRRVLHDHVVEGEHGWVLGSVVSRASFRRVAASGQTDFTFFLITHQ